MFLRSHARRLLSAQSDIQADKNKLTNNEDPSPRSARRLRSQSHTKVNKEKRPNNANLSRSARRLQSAQSHTKVDNEKRPKSANLSRSARCKQSAQSHIKVDNEKRPNKEDLSRSARCKQSTQSHIKVDNEKRPNKEDLSPFARRSQSAQSHTKVDNEKCINMEDLLHSEATPDCPNNADTSTGTPVPTKVYAPLVNCYLNETPPPSDGDVTLIENVVSEATSSNREAEFLPVHTEVTNQLVPLSLDDLTTPYEDDSMEWDEILQQIGDYGMLSPSHSEQSKEPHYEPQEPYFVPAYTSSNMGHIESECTCNTAELRKSVQFAFDRLGDVYTAHPWLFNGINMDHWQDSSKHKCDSNCEAHRIIVLE